MTVMQQYQGPSGHSGNLYEVLDLILDKGLVIDVFARVSVVGIELITIDIRIVVASVDTYLRFAEACNRLDLSDSRGVGLPDLVGGATQKGAQSKTKGALKGAKDAITDSFQQGRADEREKSAEPERRRKGTRTTGGSEKQAHK
ncbi:gas vesicle structural protein GvpA [Nocardiopsis alkaliphila]|nr:gas vesicle structural protein GvpA [Nocardiopsis alkaliphila]